MAVKFPFPTASGDVGGGPAVGYISVLPGAGATTLACLTALSLAETGKQVALADFSLLSKTRTYLGLTLDVCPASVLDAAGVRSPEEIRRAGVDHPRSIFVIPGAARQLDSAQVDSRLVSRTVSFLKREFDYIVVVLPQLSGAGWAGALICDVVCLVVRPDRADIDYYRDAVDFLSRLGCGERLKIILNQSRAPGGLRDDEITEILKPDCVFPYDPAVRTMCNKRYLDTLRFKKQLVKLVREDGEDA